MRFFEKVKRIEEDIRMPERSTEDSAGYDFFAIEDVYVPPYEIGDDPFMIPTGVKAQVERREFIMLVNRSSNPKKKKLVIPNSVGVIDSDYFENQDNDGEMFFGFYNLSNDYIFIEKGERLGQGIIMEYKIVDNDKAVGKRNGGWGSTGK